MVLLWGFRGKKKTFYAEHNEEVIGISVISFISHSGQFRQAVTCNNREHFTF